MASFSPNIDLLSIPGAKPVTFEEGGRKVNYICIPADLNEIKIEPSRADNNTLTAYLRTKMFPFSQSYINTIVSNKQRRGDTVDMSKIESHELVLSHSKEYIDAWTPRVVAKLVKEHPEWSALNPAEKNDLYYAVRRLINKRIGKAYPAMSDGQQAPAPVPAQFNAPPQFTDYMAPPVSVQQAPAASVQQAPAADDDLPF